MLVLKMRAGWLAAGAAIALGTAAPANAAAIMGLYDTGVDDNGIVLAPGQVDRHYEITATSNPGVTVPAAGSPAFITTGVSSWSPNSAVGSNGSSWITSTLAADGVSAGNTGKIGQNNSLGYTYDYTLSFSLGTLSAASAMISGQVQSDNFVRILLNGTDIGGQFAAPSPGNATAFQSFSIFGASSNFLGGPGNVNTLTFRVTDYGIVSGLRVDNLLGTAVPEPATWAMLIVGFGLVASQIRRRRRAGTMAIA